jgi:hypothetical protein
MIFYKRKTNNIIDNKPKIILVLTIILGILFFLAFLYLSIIYSIKTEVIGIIEFIYILLFSLTIMLSINNKYKEASRTIFILKEQTLYMVKFSNQESVDKLKTEMLNNSMLFYDEIINNIENNITTKIIIEFITMKKPKIEKVNKNKIYISYETETGREMLPFNNLYDNVIEKIKSIENEIGPTPTALLSKNFINKRNYEIQSDVVVITGMFLMFIAILKGKSIFLVAILFLAIESLIWELYLKKLKNRIK